MAKILQKNDIDERVEIFTLSNPNNMSVKITNYGGIILSIVCPDKLGNLDDITLGYENVVDYLKDTTYFGALIGRYANRIGNAQFRLNNKTYQLANNDGANHLHGGHQGYHRAIWDPLLVTDEKETKLELCYHSEDGEENYPGNLRIKVTYSLTEDNELIIDYRAVSDKDTIVNLTNHAYFNLAGHKQGDILNHHLSINANYYTPIDNNLIPTGDILGVAGTAMDFRELKPISAMIRADEKQLVYGQGFDHNWVLNKSNQPNAIEKAAELYEPDSGRFMEVFSSKPGIQFYSGNSIQGPLAGKDGAVYQKHSGLCLETQHFPNSPNYSHFPSPILRAGQDYRHTTIYKFGVRP